MDFGEPQDATYDPDDSITVLTESADGTDVIYKKGECTAKPVKADATFRDSHRLYLKSKHTTVYNVDNLLGLIFHEVFQDPAPYVNEELKISKPSGNTLRIWSTTQEGRTTLILRPRGPQHQLTKLLYAKYL
ncbi:unnamed protein product [Pleuronectes platessa]|uniref:Uncharacterized protein n=1 Tax=Pleuronectes platessa TaxID=8262 RepID=A0A9N7YW53_PLEPL|nr:unnamed protein product [Pleuronectes platessa]